jgi:hypothetical protein
MPISNVSGSNFTTLYSSQGNANPYVPIPPSNANVSGQNYTTLYSAGSGTAPVPAESYGNANVESFLAVGSDTGGNVVGNILSSGLISATGNIITDEYFIGTFLGNITGNFVIPGFNTQVVYNNNGNAAASSGLTFVATSNTLTSGNVVSAVGNVRGGNLTTTGQVSATGNITGNYFLGNGSQLSGLPVQYGNANVVTLLAAFGSNVISTTGNITAGYFVGNGSTLTNLTAGNIVGTVANATYALNANAATYATNAIQANVANVANSVAGANVSGTVANAAYALNSNAATFAGTVTTAAQPNITSVGILTAINTSGAISATGNITGNVFSGNGSGLTNINAANIIGAYGNANVAANLAAFATNPISTSGNITAGYFIGNGAALTSLTGANVTGVVANATYALNANAATYATNAIQANVANVANSVAGANVSGTVANATYALNANASTFAGTVTDAAQPNITSVGILTAINTSGAISATGNITGNVFIGNGAGLTNINAANIIGAYGNANVAANLAAFANNPISTSGNITAGNFIGNGAALTSLTGANVTGVVANATYALNANAATYATNAVQANYANVANSVAGGNVSGQVANALVAGTVYTNAQPNITSVGTLTSLSVSGNITTGNLSTAGNVTADYFIGNIAGNVAGNSISVSGNITGGNLLTNGQVSATGNITGNYIIGNGSALSGITGANVSGVVPLAQYVTQNAQANITSVGTLTGLSVSGNTTSGNISAVGNINGANLNISNDALILGNLTVNGNTTFINSNVVTINDKFINLANNAANASVANGGGIGIGPIASEYATLTYDYLANVWTTNIGISATGNVTANYFIGNGAALTSLTGANVTGTVANATYALNANAATFAGTVTTNAQPNITSVGILTAVNTSGDISATGNITGNVFSGNAAGLTNIPGGNVTGTVPLAQYVTQNAQANITSVGVLSALSVSGNVTAGNITNNGTITSVGNITAPWFIGNVQGNIVGNVDAGGANTQVQFNDSDVLNGTAGFTFDKTSNAVVITGNITSANVSTTGLVTATGNITGGNIASLGTVTATGNIGTTQQTIIGTANATASATGNIVVSGKNIATDVVFAPDASTTTTPTGGRVLIGSGVAGNTSILAYDATNILRGPRVAIMDAWTKNNAAVISGALTTWAAASLDGNITAVGSRVHGITSYVNVSGGAAGNTYLTTGGGAINNGLNAISGVLSLGGANPNLVTQIGANITTRYATATSGVLQFYGNGTVVGNGYGHISTVFNNATGNISIANVAAYGIGLTDLVTTTATVGNTIGYLFPDHISSQFGLGSIGSSFQRGNVYAFLNAGNLAQVRLGSTIEQHYYAYPIPTTTGNVTINAVNGQVQTVTPTGAMAITDVTNLVTSAYNTATTLTAPQSQSVTVQIRQGATGYAVTLPTTLGGGPVFYADGFNTVSTTAYATTTVTFYQTPSGITGGTPFYVEVKSSDAGGGAAGDDGLIQFNIGGANLTGGRLAANGNLFYNNSTLTLQTQNCNVVADLNALGNINGGTLNTGGTISATGNITGGNITTTGISNLGSLKTYTEAQYILPTSGSITVSKLNGQVQYMSLTGNVTSIGLTDFVTAQGGVAQADTVTLIIQQGATPYSVTMPTNSAIKYAGNITSVSATANSVTMASISAVNAGGSALYLITVSPEFI